MPVRVQVCVCVYVFRLCSQTAKNKKISECRINIRHLQLWNVRQEVGSDGGRRKLAPLHRTLQKAKQPSVTLARLAAGFASLPLQGSPVAVLQTCLGTLLMLTGSLGGSTPGHLLHGLGGPYVCTWLWG